MVRCVSGRGIVQMVGGLGFQIEEVEKMRIRYLDEIFKKNWCYHRIIRIYCNYDVHLILK